MNFFLKDRIKETSRSTGLGDFVLDGAAPGFSAFGDYYSNGDSFFYAITDGQAYEVGSGVYNIGASNTLTRFPIQSTNSDSAVDFTDGLKEVFVTYPGKGAVYSAEDHDYNQQPADSGVAFYSSNQIVNYDRMIIWDSGKSSLGISQQSPTYAVDVGGEIDYSVVRASGFIDGGSGVLFSGVLGSFSGGRQLEPFLRNVTNNETGSDAVIRLSGVVNQGILLHKQLPRTIFAGPTSDCGCVDDYPTFRLLENEDLPISQIDRIVRQDDVGLDGYSVNLSNRYFRSGSVALYSASGYITYDSGILFDAINNRLLIRDNSTIQDPRVTLDVDGDIYSTNIQASGYIRTSGDIRTSGIFSTEQGMNIDSNVPSVTTNMLYNDGGSLYWNGASLVAPSYTFKATDGYQLGDSISDGETLTVSGVSGVAVRYAANTNSFTVGAAELSGVLQGQIDDFSAGAFSFSVTNGKFADDSILNTETITISGVSGVSSEYDPATNFFRIGASGLSGVLQDQIDEHSDYLSNEFGLISLSGVSGVAFYASGWIDSFNPSVTSIEGTSGVAKVDNHYVLDQNGSGILKRLSLYDDKAVILGGSGCHGSYAYSSGINIGNHVGLDSYKTECSINIGYDSSVRSSGSANKISIGCESSYEATDISRSIAIGNEALKDASGVSDSILIGLRSGAEAEGQKGSLGYNSVIAIGKRTLESSTGSIDGTIALGDLSHRFAQSCVSGISLGNATNTSSIQNTRCVHIGNSAGNTSSNSEEVYAIGTAVVQGAKNINNSVFFGRESGFEASGTNSSTHIMLNAVAIGQNSLREARDANDTVAIGRSAGTRSWGVSNCIYIGAVAGSGRHFRTGDIIFSNTQTTPNAYNPTFGTGNGKNGVGWSSSTDDILEISTAIQGYINDLEDDDNRDIRIHIGAPLSTNSQLKSTLQLNRTAPDDYHIYLENSGNLSANESEIDMAMADSPLKDTNVGEDGIPFVGPSGFMRVPWCVRTGGDELLYNGIQVPHIDGTIVGWMDSDTAPTNFGWAIGFFKGLPPMLGVSDGWVFHTGVKP